jgi:hypothetical protein
VLVDSGTRTIQTTVEQDNDEALRTKLQTAYDANRTYLALNNPTAAQNTAQVQRLTREVNALIRLTLQQLDSTEGT